MPHTNQCEKMIKSNSTRETRTNGLQIDTQKVQVDTKYLSNNFKYQYT